MKPYNPSSNNQTAKTSNAALRENPQAHAGE